MKKILYLLSALICFGSCITSNFSLTGTVYEPLPDDYPVKVVLTNSPLDFSYDEIGILQVNQSDENNFSKVLDFAKKKARLNGGDMIKLISSDSKTSISGNKNGVYSSENNSYLFVICKIQK